MPSIRKKILIGIALAFFLFIPIFSFLLSQNDNIIVENNNPLYYVSYKPNSVFLTRLRSWEKRQGKNAVKIKTVKIVAQQPPFFLYSLYQDPKSAKMIIGSNLTADGGKNGTLEVYFNPEFKNSYSDKELSFFMSNTIFQALYNYSIKYMPSMVGDSMEELQKTLYDINTAHNTPFAVKVAR